jgi:general secretion pathway protein I
MNAPTLRRLPRGFTLVEVLVALMIVAIGLAALLVAVSGTARTSGYLRDKTLAQWIALNRLTEVRLNSNNKFAQNTDTAEVKFAGRTWHYDTRYFDTSISTMKRVVVRVYLGDAKTKGNPLAESTSFLGTALGAPGGSNTPWDAGSTVQSATNPTNGTVTPGVNSPGNTPVVPPGSSGPQPTSPVNPAPNPQ